MKKYVVSLLAFFMFLLLQTPLAGAGHSARVGFTSRSFAVRAGPRHFVSPSVVIINPAPARFVRVTPFTREVIILPHHRFIGNTVIIREPFFCFGHRTGFINEASFFDHIHSFHGVAFEAIPNVVVRSDPQVFFFED